MVALWALVRRRRRAAEERAFVAALASRFTRPFTHPLEFCEKTMLLYEFGAYGLVERDAGALREAVRTSFLRACEAEGVRGDMAARQGTVAFKKVCLRLYHETLRLALDLERLSAFFFVDRTGDGLSPGSARRGLFREPRLSPRFTTS